MNAIVAAALRRDLNSFVRKTFQTILPGTAYLPNWHIYAIVHQLMRVHAGDISRLLINQPPRSLKSICVSVAYTAWVLGVTDILGEKNPGDRLRDGGCRRE